MELARLQAGLTFVWLGAVAAWVLWHRAWPCLALAGALAIALAHAWVLALEFIVQRWVSRHDRLPRAPAWQLWRAWAGEVLLVPRVFCWHQPFCSRRHPDLLDPRHRGRRGVLLVHGYLCNRGMWNAWLARLHRQDRPFIAIDLGPPFGPIDEGLPTIEAAVARLTEVTGLPPLVVGHSMGGVALRAWLRHMRQPARAHRWVTLGSPHAGTWLARFGHSPNARQLRPGHPWLLSLERDCDPEWARHFVCVVSNADHIVFPPSRATLAGADNRLLPGLAHVQLAWRPEVMDSVLALLDAPALQTGGAQRPAGAAGSSVGSTDSCA